MYIRSFLNVMCLRCFPHKGLKKRFGFFFCLWLFSFLTIYRRCFLTGASYFAGYHEFFHARELISSNRPTEVSLIFEAGKHFPGMTGSDPPGGKRWKSYCCCKHDGSYLQIHYSRLPKRNVIQHQRFSGPFFQIPSGYATCLSSRRT